MGRCAFAGAARKRYARATRDGAYRWWSILWLRFFPENWRERPNAGMMFAGSRFGSSVPIRYRSARTWPPVPLIVATSDRLPRGDLAGSTREAPDESPGFSRFWAQVCEFVSRTP